MQKPITTIDELYARQEPMGEVTLDAVFDALKHSRVHYPADLALLMGVDQRHLQGAVTLLTGMELKDLILEWRMQQAKEMILAATATETETRSATVTQTETRSATAIKAEMEAIARRCGWASRVTMCHTFKSRWGVSPYKLR